MTNYRTPYRAARRITAQTDPFPVSSSQSASTVHPWHDTNSGAQIVRDVPVAQAQSSPRYQTGSSVQ